jgi:hypothetical protein
MLQKACALQTMLPIVYSAHDLCRKGRAHGLVGPVTASRTGGPISSLLHLVSMQSVCQVATCVFTLNAVSNAVGFAALISHVHAFLALLRSGRNDVA